MMNKRCKCSSSRKKRWHNCPIVNSFLRWWIRAGWIGLVGNFTRGWLVGMGERSGSYGQLETSNKLCKWTKLDLNPCQQNKLPGLWSVHNRISQKLRDVATIENVSHIDAGLVYHFICPFWFMHVWNFEIQKGIKASHQKEWIFYGQADRKGGGGQPRRPWP